MKKNLMNKFSNSIKNETLFPSRIRFSNFNLFIQLKMLCPMIFLKNCRPKKKNWPTFKEINKAKNQKFVYLKIFLIFSIIY